MLTVAIVTFNSRTTIQRTLDSILENESRRLPIKTVVVDNCSTDGTREFIAGYAAQHDHVSLLQNSRNTGFASGHNLALAQIDSDYHVILSQRF